MNRRSQRQKDNGIPTRLLIAAADKMLRKQYSQDDDRCVDNWVTYEYEKCRKLCGPEYGHHPIDDVRRQLVNLRKGGKLVSRGGHGPSKHEVPPGYQAYLQTPHWKAFANKVRAFWDCRCAFCYSAEPLDVHHRTYDRLGHEELTDCIALCHKCHKRADSGRQRSSVRYDLFE